MRNQKTVSRATYFSNKIVSYTQYDYNWKGYTHVLYFGCTSVPYILESNPHPNLIRTSICRFLKRKKS